MKENFLFPLGSGQDLKRFIGKLMTRLLTEQWIAARSSLMPVDKLWRTL